MKDKHRAIIYNNKLYFYDYKNDNIDVTLCSLQSLKNNKIYDLNSFLNDVKSSSVIKKISNKLVGEKIEIVFWSNYSEVDKKALLELFNNLNFSLVDFIDIKDILNEKLPIIIVSLDGIYLISEISAYFNYISHNDSIIEAIDFIKKRYGISKYILIGNRNGLSLIDDSAYLYENNDTYFEDLLKNMD